MMILRLFVKLTEIKFFKNIPKYFLFIILISILISIFNFFSYDRSKLVVASIRIGYGIFELKTYSGHHQSALPIESKNSLSLRLLNINSYESEVFRSCKKVDNFFYKKIILKRIDRSPMTYRIGIDIGNSNDAIECLNLIISMLFQKQVEMLESFRDNANVSGGEEIIHDSISNADTETNNFFNKTISIISNRQYILLDDLSANSEKIKNTIFVLNPEVIEAPHQINFSDEFNQSFDIIRYLIVLIIFIIIKFSENGKRLTSNLAE